MFWHKPGAKPDYNRDRWPGIWFVDNIGTREIIAAPRLTGPGYDTDLLGAVSLMLEAGFPPIPEEVMAKFIAGMEKLKKEGYHEHG